MTVAALLDDAESHELENGLGASGYAEYLAFAAEVHEALIVEGRTARITRLHEDGYAVAVHLRNGLVCKCRQHVDLHDDGTIAILENAREGREVRYRFDGSIEIVWTNGQRHCKCPDQKIVWDQTPRGSRHIRHFGNTR